MTVPFRYHNGTKWVLNDAGAIVDANGNRVTADTVKGHLEDNDSHITATERNNWNNKVDKVEKGSANGVAELDSNGQVKAEQLKVLDRLSYDQYILWLELYYKGVISHVETTSVKAIMFEGFLNPDNINSNSTGVLINNKYYANTSGGTGLDTGLQTEASLPNLQSDYSFSQTFRASGTGTIEIYSDNTNSGGRTNFSLYEGSPVTSMGSIVKSGSESYPFGANTTLRWKRPIESYTFDPNKTYTFVANKITDSEGVSSFKWSTTTATNEFCYARQGSSPTTLHSSRASNFAFRLTGGAKLIPFIDSHLYSKPKTLPYVPSKAKLYISIKKPTSTGIIPAISVNGTTFETMTLSTSRPDPRDSDFTEYEYDVAFTTTGQTMQLRVLLDAINSASPEIYRYGLILY